jgi:hypothetical protein
MNYYQDFNDGGQESRTANKVLPKEGLYGGNGRPIRLGICTRFNIRSSIELECYKYLSFLNAQTVVNKRFGWH